VTLFGRSKLQGRVLILAGGGGHTGIAYALAQALYKRVSISFLAPEGDTFSKERLSKFGKVEFLIKPRGSKTSAPIFAVRLTKALMDSARKTFHGFDVVVSTGSNFCVPPAILAWIRGVAVINIESLVRFTSPSKTARILQPFSTVTALHWDEQGRFMKGIVVGPTLAKPQFKPWNGGYILVSGGTQGHRLLFDVFSESNLDNVVLQTGQINPEPYAKKHPDWKVITLTTGFHELLAGAELVATHSGQTALEAALYKKPVVLAPNPEWTRTAGIADSEYLARKINAVLVYEINLETILGAVKEARKREVPTLPNGAENLANIIVRLSEGRGPASHRVP
jgi:UDP-N-acetylglucosamine--N-acetylmuramyl-(pentapeptide) pyrophosphoryl-undecaprenol N-acetylglucosamine transferase